MVSCIFFPFTQVYHHNVPVYRCINMLFYGIAQYSMHMPRFVLVSIGASVFCLGSYVSDLV